MINLLPAAVKKERQFGRMNRLLIRVLIGMFIIAGVATAVMLFGLQLTNNDETLLNQVVEDRTKIYEANKVYETQASDLKGDLTTISKVFDREVKLSNLLVEIASTIPFGVQLTGLSLTGNDTSPLQITATARSQELAGTLRRNLVDSGVFEAADLQTVTLQASEDDKESYSVTLLATLSGSAEKLQKEKAAAQAAAAAAAQASQTGEAAQ